MHDLIRSKEILSEVTLPSLSREVVQQIAAGMPEIHRASKSFGRSNSQTTSRLMSLTMLTACSPYRVLRQCVAEITKRQQALQEAIINLKVDRLKAERLQASEDALDQLEAEKLLLKLDGSMLYVEGALKDIATFQDAYEQVRVSNGIRAEWDERDFEEAEIRHHTRTAFLHTYRDIMAGGRVGMGTLEYLEQFGIHPQVALREASEYYDAVTRLPEPPTAEHLHAWLDDMADKHSDAHAAALSRLGVTAAFNTEAQYLTER